VLYYITDYATSVRWQSHHYSPPPYFSLSLYRPNLWQCKF